MALPATENFVGADFTFPPNANWSTLDGNVQILSNSADGVAADGNVIYWDTDVFPNDQYAQCIPSGVVPTGNGAGPAVRLSGTTGYFANLEGDTQITLFRWDGDETYVPLQVFSGLTLTQGTDVVKLTIQGSTLRVYVNDIQIGTDETDGTYASGSAGLFMYNTNAKINLWEGGEVVASDSISWLPQVRSQAGRVTVIPSGMMP